MQNRRTKGHVNIGSGGLGSGLRKLAGAVRRGAVVMAVVFAGLLIAGAAQAQVGPLAKSKGKETVLYNFTGAPDGANPQAALVADSGGNLYGTTNAGGLGFGTVFEISASGEETVLYRFCSAMNCTDGATPLYASLIFDRAGNLYGTTEFGGAYANGTVFELSPNGGGWNETVLYSFTGGADGANPVNTPIMDGSGNLYGTTLNGGDGAAGTVYELSPSGNGWTEQTIQTVNWGDYTGPTYAGLSFYDGGIYGVTNSNLMHQQKGQMAHQLKAFLLTPNGGGGWNLSLIFPQSKARGVDEGSNVQGTIVGGFGTASNGRYYPQCGMVYTAGTFYANAYVFKTGIGCNPFAGILQDGANLYGTTVNGGAYGYGTVYELTRPKTNYKPTLLWSFNGTDGANPYGSLIRDGAGNLYGTTQYGGANGAGVVFKVVP